MSSNRWALVCTIGNNLGETFPFRKILTFDTDQEAFEHAADLLCENGEEVTRTSKGLYRYKKQFWTASQVVVEWCETNLCLELFDIWEVNHIANCEGNE